MHYYYCQAYFDHPFSIEHTQNPEPPDVSFQRMVDYRLKRTGTDFIHYGKDGGSHYNFICRYLRSNLSAPILRKHLERFFLPEPYVANNEIVPKLIIFIPMATDSLVFEDQVLAECFIEKEPK